MAYYVLMSKSIITKNKSSKLQGHGSKETILPWAVSGRFLLDVSEGGSATEHRPEDFPEGEITAVPNSDTDGPHPVQACHWVVFYVYNVSLKC